MHVQVSRDVYMLGEKCVGMNLHGGRGTQGHEGGVRVPRNVEEEGHIEICTGRGLQGYVSGVYGAIKCSVSFSNF